MRHEAGHEGSRRRAGRVTLERMNHKRKGPKQSRSGCMLCKPSKNSHNRTADRMRGKRDWRRLEQRAWGESV
jgi:hypothetical protein